jgi:hypothetical protein
VKKPLTVSQSVSGRPPMAGDYRQASSVNEENMTSLRKVSLYIYYAYKNKKMGVDLKTLTSEIPPE